MSPANSTKKLLKTTLLLVIHVSLAAGATAEQVQYLFNSRGDFIAFRIKNNIFNSKGNWIGWLGWRNADVATPKGKYFGTILNGNRLYRFNREYNEDPGYPGYPGHPGYPGSPGNAGESTIPDGAIDVVIPSGE